jgi:hypothetical protein
MPAVVAERLTKRRRRARQGAFGALLNLLLIVIEIVVIVFGVAFWVGSMMVVGVLNEIRQRDFSAPLERVAKYEEFFGERRKQGFNVVEDKPRIDEGVTKYLWTVEPPGRAGMFRFEWAHDLEANAVTPRTNAALLLDLELGYVNATEARSYTFFNPSDPVVPEVLEHGTARPPGGPLAVSNGQVGPEQGVMPPLISPEEARGRAARAKKTEEPAAEGETGTEAGAEGGGAVEVNPPDQGGEPPATPVEPGDGGSGVGGAGDGGQPTTPPEGGH